MSELAFTTLGANSVDDKLVIFLFPPPPHPHKTLETICMKCQNLFSKKNKKKKINMSSAENFTQGPVVQSIVYLKSSLMTNSLSIVTKIFSDTFIFLLQKCEYFSYFFFSNQFQCI